MLTSQPEAFTKKEKDSDRKLRRPRKPAWPGAFEATVISPAPLTFLAFDEAVAHQGPVYGTVPGYRWRAGLAQFVTDGLQAPGRVGQAQLHHPGFDFGAHLVRAARRARGAVGQAGQAVVAVTA
jgi:hypothetical protein